jgi:hypothetical protein
MHLRKLILFLCLSLADLGLTWHLLSRADGRVYEGNPLARWWLVNYGWGGLTLFKLTMALFVVGVTLVIARQRPRTAGKVLVVSCGILAVVVLYSSFLAGAVAAHPFSDDGLPDPELAVVFAQGQGLDQQLQQAEAYHQLLERLTADVIARRRSLPEAANLLAASGQGCSPGWLNYLERLYPGQSKRGRLAANLIYFALLSLQEGSAQDEECARRLAADYRACYGVSFRFPDQLAAPATGRWPTLSDDPSPGP